MEELRSVHEKELTEKDATIRALEEENDCLASEMAQFMRENKELENQVGDNPERLRRLRYVHELCQITVQFGWNWTRERERRSWRLNENLFRYEENVEECKKQMKDFFVTNMHQGTPIEMVWDASKAYMRGVLVYLNNIGVEWNISVRS